MLLRISSSTILVPPSYDPGVHGQGPTSLKAGITKGFDLRKDNPMIRYAVTGADISKFRDIDGKQTFAEWIKPEHLSEEGAKPALARELGATPDQSYQIVESRKKLSAFDFDDTLAETNNKVLVTHGDGTISELNSEQFATFVPQELDKLDFSDFDNVEVEKVLPGFDKLKAAIAKGNDVVILTARTMRAEADIRKFLNHKLGEDAAKVKFKGVGHSSPQAKANYLDNAIKKYGYESVYFIDDSQKNLDGVKQVLKDKVETELADYGIKLDESRKVDLGKSLDDIVTQRTGVKGTKFDAVDIKNAQNKWRLKFWLPPSAEDLKGLVYSIIPGGKDGQKALEFFDTTIFKPFSEAMAKFDQEKIQGFKAVKELAKKFDLDKDIGNGLTAEQAIRIFLFRENGSDLEGVSQDKIDHAVAYVLTERGVKGLVGKIQKSANYSYDTFEADTWLAGSLQGDLFGYYNSVRRKELLEPWKNNWDNMFTKENLNKLKVTHGEAFVSALENTKQRMWSGRNRTVNPDGSTNKLMDWINNAVGTTMFLNMRSATLQMLSTVNYLFEPGTMRGFSSGFASTVVDLWNSDYLKSRRGEAGFDMQAAEVAATLNNPNGFKKMVAKLIQFGFKPTKAIDSFAISFFGAAFVNGQIKNGVPKQEAIRRWREVSEENQQSARPDKISQIQAGPLGRVIFAFGNTPFQYARITKRSTQDLLSGRSKNPGKDAAKIVWYGALQSLIFTQLQNAINLFDDDEDEDDKQKEWAINSFITSYLKAFGLGGAVAAGAYPVLNDLKKMAEGERIAADTFLLDAVSVSPPIQSRLRKLNKIRRSAQYNGEDLLDPRTEEFWKALGYGLNVGANIPLDRAITKLNNLSDIVNEENGFNNELLLALGWSKWQLGISDQQKKKSSTIDPFDKDEEIDFDPFLEDQEDFDPFAEEDDEFSPFNRDEVGQILNDGTIQVDPNLSPLEREKTIKHEMEHLRQMQEDGLDYDDNYIYYKGKKHMRRDGKIRYNGRWHEEGAKGLPWEAAAYKAE